MNITFIGNCQTLSLCFYLQQLLKNNNNIYWIVYGDEFKRVLGGWSNKCKNKILDYEKSLEQIKISDIIIYQEISTTKSLLSNKKLLQEIKKDSCKLIVIPCTYLDYTNYDNSIIDLQNRENENNVDIKVSVILNKYKNTKLMLSKNHPNTFLFLEIIKELCLLLNIEFFKDVEYKKFIKLNNYMHLPNE